MLLIYSWNPEALGPKDIQKCDIDRSLMNPPICTAAIPINIVIVGIMFVFTPWTFPTLIQCTTMSSMDAP